MGQSPKPVNIYVTDKEMLKWDVLKELNEKGNTVRAIKLKPNTLMIGPSCHRVLEGMEKYVEVAVKSARQSWTPVCTTPSTKPKKRVSSKKRVTPKTVEKQT